MDAFGQMSPQLLRVLFAGADAQRQGYETVLGMLWETGVRFVTVDGEKGEDSILTPQEYAESVMRNLLDTYGLPVFFTAELGEDGS